MACDQKQLLWLNESYKRATGKCVRRFVCPITLLDDADAELCDGHILDRGIRKASRATVVQRKDVDGFFGTSIEPDFIKLINLYGSSEAEQLKKARSLELTHPNGQKLKAFFARRSAAKKFQQISLLDAEGEEVASPFVRDANLGNELIKNFEVEWTVSYKKSAIVGSLLKSAYLAQFRMLGYEWVLSPGGDKIRRVLNAFYEAQRRKSGRKDFDEFRNVAMFMEDDAMRPRQDTLTGGNLFFHSCAKGTDKELLFGLSTLFSMNGRTWVVTLPIHQKFGYFSVAYEHYSAYLKNRTYSPNAYPGYYRGGKFHIASHPINVTLSTKR